ncbi:rh5-interacting protein isoform X1 [Parasteatoda tepidariorum]|uniref:rh5-interacting protein isoform X1 n=1 Tax=Parasteatoda tepidariorum TaxID=114398 RepID=UPI001C723D73|nr:rh5-interacting protein isoform X1 [Parasteatoda tepidariorum]
MVVLCLLVTFLLGVNLSDQVSVQAKNITDILEEQNENKLQPLTSDSKNIIGLKNESYYEQECDCGFGSRSCYYNSYGVKICDCRTDYEENNGKCERCYCGFNARSCTFINNKKVCRCPENYLQNDFGQCIECDCGYDAISCHLKGFSKVCTCRKGYIAEYGKCERCDCGPNSISCELTSDKYTRCTCVAGYVAERRTWEMDETCKLPEASGWRIATYIESVIFALIIIVCTIIICCKRMSD